MNHTFISSLSFKKSGVVHRTGNGSNIAS